MFPYNSTAPFTSACALTSLGPYVLPYIEHITIRAKVANSNPTYLRFLKKDWRC